LEIIHTVGVAVGRNLHPAFVYGRAMATAGYGKRTLHSRHALTTAGCRREVALL
jgi:hypothetical protein